MKKMAVLLVSLLVVACNTAKQKDSATPAQADTKTTAPVSAGRVEPAQTAGADLSGLQQSIYFDFAKADISAEYKDLIVKQAEAAKGGKNAVVTLEGNCDERGSSEYNLALGQRRADAVRKLMVAAGADGRQLKAASLGKEKPRLSCHEEKCWKENRRVDFVAG